MGKVQLFLFIFSISFLLLFFLFRLRHKVYVRSKTNYRMVVPLSALSFTFQKGKEKKREKIHLKKNLIIVLSSFFDYSGINPVLKRKQTHSSWTTNNVKFSSVFYFTAYSSSFHRLLHFLHRNTFYSIAYLIQSIVIFRRLCLQ